MTINYVSCAIQTHLVFFLFQLLITILRQRNGTFFNNNFVSKSAIRHCNEYSKYLIKVGRSHYVHLLILYLLIRQVHYFVISLNSEDHYISLLSSESLTSTYASSTGYIAANFSAIRDKML